MKNKFAFFLNLFYFFCFDKQTHEMKDVNEFLTMILGIIQGITEVSNALRFLFMKTLNIKLK